MDAKKLHINSVMEGGARTKIICNILCQIKKFVIVLFLYYIVLMGYYLLECNIFSKNTFLIYYFFSNFFLFFKYITSFWKKNKSSFQSDSASFERFNRFLFHCQVTHYDSDFPNHDTNIDTKYSPIEFRTCDILHTEYCLLAVYQSLVLVEIFFIKQTYLSAIYS